MNYCRGPLVAHLHLHLPTNELPGPEAVIGMAGVRRPGVPDCQLPRLGEAGAGEYGEDQARPAS
jgi:hypothetical protein